MKRTLERMTLGFAAAAVIALAACTEARTVAGPDDASLTQAAAPSFVGERNYLVQIENFSFGQPLSPAVIATHKSAVKLFNVGGKATEGLHELAEFGDPALLAKEFWQQGGVYDIIVTTAPIHRIGGSGPSSISVKLRAGEGANYLSMASMMFCTNDGFAGVDALPLPTATAPVRTYDVPIYDAGTELDDELAVNLAPECGRFGPVWLPPGGNGCIVTQEPIALHRGIRGVGDLLVGRHGWHSSNIRSPVRITVTLIQ